MNWREIGQLFWIAFSVVTLGSLSFGLIATLVTAIGFSRNTAIIVAMVCVIPVLVVFYAIVVGPKPKDND